MRWLFAFRSAEMVKQICRHHGCRALVDQGEGFCPRHANSRNSVTDRWRGSSSSRGYDYRWSVFARGYLMRFPRCKGLHDTVVLASEVDHIVPLAEAPERKYDETNLQGLCKSCHSKKTMTERLKKYANTEGGGW